MENLKDNKQYMKQSFVVAVVAVAVIAVIVVALLFLLLWLKLNLQTSKVWKKEKEFRVFLILGNPRFWRGKRDWISKALLLFLLGGRGGGFPLCVGILFSMQNGSLGWKRLSILGLTDDYPDSCPFISSTILFFFGVSRKGRLCWFKLQKWDFFFFFVWFW